MARTPTVYLHIGTHKTGTTALQRWLYANRSRLAEHGLLLPVDGPYYCPPGRSRPPEDGGHWSLAFSMMGTRPHWMSTGQVPSFDSCRAALRADLESWRSLRGARRADVLLSSEHWFVGVAPTALAGLFADLGFRVVVVAYLRRQDDFLLSLHNQWVKTGRITETFAEFLDAQVEDPHSYAYYHRHLDAFSQVFGRDALVVRRFEEAKMVSRDLIADFTSLLDLALPPPTSAELHHNDSVPTELLEVIRHEVAKLPSSTPHPERAQLARELRARGAPPITDHRRYALLPRGWRQALLSHFANDNARIARDFLGLPGDSLFEQSEPPLDEPLWTGLRPEVVARVRAAMRRHEEAARAVEKL